MPIAGHKIWTSPIMKKPSFRVTLWSGFDFQLNLLSNCCGHCGRALLCQPVASFRWESRPKFNMNKYKNGERDWYNKITDSLYLGAIPLKSSSTIGHQGEPFNVEAKNLSIKRSTRHNTRQNGQWTRHQRCSFNKRRIWKGSDPDSRRVGRSRSRNETH